MVSALERLRELRTKDADTEDLPQTPASINARPMPIRPQVKTADPRIAGLTIADFAGSGRVLRVWSEHLGCEILLAADNAEIADSETRPVYRACEMEALLDATPEGLCLLNETKMIFGGQVQPEKEYIINEALADRAIEESEEYTQAAADTLDILVKAGGPVSHPQIVKSLILRGHSKQAAKDAIASCQAKRWIYHNLETGYEMSDLSSCQRKAYE